MNEEKERLSLVGHLSELRSRIIISLASIAAASVAGYFFSPRILEIFLAPATHAGGNLVFLKPTEAFLVTLKISLIFGIVVSAPIVLYQFWAFAAPGLKKNEIRLFLPATIFSPLLFFLGVFFAYSVVLPMGLKFLMGFAAPAVQPFFSIAYYVSFAGMLLLSFGIVFELPLAVVILIRLNIVSPEMLRKKRREVIVGILILSAILSPPDIFTQLLLSIPLFLLYEISIVIARACHRKEGN